MQRFKNILLVHESGTRGRKARERVLELARRNEARIKLIEIAAPLPAGNSQYKASGVVLDLASLVAQERQGVLDKVAAEMAAEGVEVTPRFTFGNPFMSLMQEIHDGGHDLVVLTSEGDGGLRDHLFGSTSRHLLRKCPCPVWVVRPARRRKTFRVLAALNPAENLPAAQDLDHTLLQISTSLARIYGGELDLVHVWQPAPKSGRVHRDIVAGWNKELAAAAEARLNGLLGQYDLTDLAPRIHLPGGPTGLRIMEVAKSRRSDILVMGTLSRTGLRGMIMGNTAETVLQHLDASVLAIKPAGFESPITFDD